jgi:predicted nucleotidyltransferase component of viral defense system
MLSHNQINELSKRFEISDIVVFREYTQLLFLKELMNQNYSKNIFFKGGTAIRLLFGGERFSEDLDFSVQGPTDLFVPFFEDFCDGLEKRWEWKFKKRNTHVGQTWVLSTAMLNQTPCYVKLDYSFRERICIKSRQN